MEQLKSITEEMNKVKSELYSGDGGLRAISSQIEELKAATGSASKPSASRSEVRRRPAAAVTDRDVKMRERRDFEQMKLDAEELEAIRALRQAEQPFQWRVFVAVFILLSIMGPLRPVLVSLYKSFFPDPDEAMWDEY
eukprot:CAMPEP_0175896166 /NCGR_PEP_ID=MMETSP0108-20121206/18_1 /TAXON_ID=195067 ORGANISM="Goniomonas pacifica, Strain CCMP1869" /NCGR_SAMPLE_ID=MMETSP0108 /ASSEMBLY_ACC=CAM_ASM_000204 /LENGTH=137 /DNA_ID=CAMNT_0017217333 /DNA_START=143 /DNA_END=556 /DNA_ORIENTATION=+